VPYKGPFDLPQQYKHFLEKTGQTPKAIVTTPDLKVGRGNTFEATPVKKWGEKRKIKIFEPKTLDKNFIDNLRKENCEVFALCAYGKILPKEILEMPKRGILNVHPSLLPHLRGASPVRTAILNNERKTGVSIIILDDKMDHGPIVAQEEVEIQNDNWPPLLPMLEEKLFRAGGKLLAQNLEKYLEGKINPKPQKDSEATFSKKIEREDGLIDLLKDTPKEIYTKYCALYGWPGIYFINPSTDGGKRKKEFPLYSFY
jgi:methionyl-tRNA formyltransferase